MHKSKNLIRILIVMFIILLNSNKIVCGNNFSDFKFPQKEQHTLQRKTTEQSPITKTVNTLIDTVINNQPIYLIKEGDHTIIEMRKDDLRPLLYHKKNDSGETKKKIEYLENNKAHLIIPAKEIDIEIDINSKTYDQATLIYLFRMLPFEKDDSKLKINFIVDTANHGVKRIDMNAKVAGTESVEVPAGTFECYKVELKAAGIIGMFFWRTKYQYYFTKDAPHYFVKYFDPDGEYIELLDYKIIND